MDEIDKQILIAIVFDLSQHQINNSKILDVTKAAMAAQISKLGMIAKGYVSHPDWHQFSRDEGGSTYMIYSYKEPPNFSVERAFRDAVILTGIQPEGEKHIILFTDRFQASNNQRYRKAFMINGIRGYDCKISVIGIGDQYDDQTLKSLCEEWEAKYLQALDLSEVGIKLQEIFGE